MAITERLRPAAASAHWRDRINNQPRKKQNVPPFRGGTQQPFYAGGDNSQPVRLGSNLSRKIAVPRKNPIAVLN
jgi:hypothetical protein